MAKKADAESSDGNENRRNGPLRIPLPFEEAVKAATETPPREKPPRKPRRKKRAAS